MSVLYLSGGCLQVVFLWVLCVWGTSCLSMPSPVIDVRSLSGCGSALRRPLLVFLIDVYCVASHLLLRDVFDYILPIRAP